MATLAVRVSEPLTEALDRQAAERSAATRALLLLGLAATSEDLRPLLPEIVAARQSRDLAPDLRQALDDLYQQTTGTAPRSDPPAEPAPPPAPSAPAARDHPSHDLDAGGFRC